MRESVPRVGIVLAALAALAVGCDGESPPPGTSTPLETAPDTVSADCPATLPEMNGAACHSEGLACSVNYQCSAVAEQVRCTCEDSRFVCHDPVGPLRAGEPPRCVNNAAGAADPCAPNLYLADGLACTEVGQSCFYQGTVCADGMTMLDWCQCKADGSGGFAFVCGVTPCATDDDAGAS